MALFVTLLKLNIRKKLFLLSSVTAQFDVSKGFKQKNRIIFTIRFNIFAY